MTIGVAIAAGVRVLLCVPFLPFSALDKVLNFKGARAQALQVVPSAGGAAALIMVGLAVEIVMPIAIVGGVADRLAAFIMAGYCGVTALLWKRFWTAGDFWQGSDSRGRGLFWDFLKNFSLAGGFLLITFGTASLTLRDVLADPLGSSHPYAGSPTRAPRAAPD